MKGIGNTPLIKLQKLVPPGSADIYVKWEGANPTGSMKDRMALSMIEGAERRGELLPGGTVIDFTGGSTGGALAMVCSAKGYKAHFISSDAFSAEKLQTMRAFGAMLDLIPAEHGNITPALFAEGQQRLKELRKQPNVFWTDQFNNIDNRNGYHAMALEIITSMDGRINEFVAGVGTGGSFSGNAEVLKEKVPGIRCVAFEPFHVRALSGGSITGSHRIEGTGSGIVPSIFRKDLADEIVPVTDEDAYETARQLARQEGIFGGISSGANVWVALQRAKAIGAGKTIVTIICDSGLKYLQGDLYK